MEATRVSRSRQRRILLNGGKPLRDSRVFWIWRTRTMTSLKLPTVFSSSGLTGSLSSTFGALLIGTCVGLALYGVLVHQAYRYFRLYSDDPASLKYLVSIVLALETFHMTLCTHFCFFYLVKNYANPIALMTGVWSINLLSVTSGVIIILSQSFFARRVYLLGSKYRIVVLVAVILLLGELALFCMATIRAFLQPAFVDFQKYTWYISAGAAAAGAADALLTTVLIIVLRNSRTGGKGTDTVIDTLMSYAINTGLLTSLVNSLSIIFSLVCPKNLLYAASGIICTKLYANSLLAALNARKALTLQARSDVEVDMSIPLGSWRQKTPRSSDVPRAVAQLPQTYTPHWRSHSFQPLPGLPSQPPRAHHSLHL